MAKQKKPPTPEEELEDLRKRLVERHEHWHTLYEEGGCDPSWSDGSNMYYVRNHICYYREEMKELCDKHGLTLPEEYSWPIPKEVPRDYMAKPDDIRAKARVSLSRYEADQDYQYLLANGYRLDDKTAASICLQAVLHYVTGLRNAIERDDLIYMRTHRNGDIYIDSFRGCAQKLKEELAKIEAAKAAAPFIPVQLSMF